MSDLTPSNDVGLVARAMLRGRFQWAYDADGVYAHETWLTEIDEKMPGGFLGFLGAPDEVFLPYKWSDLWEPIINFS